MTRQGGFGIVTRSTRPQELGFEKRAIYDEARRRFDRVLLIDPARVWFGFVRDRQDPIVRDGGEDLASLEWLHVRDTRGREASIALLAHSLSLCGVSVSDPLDRFPTSGASKLLTTVQRHAKGVGSDTYFAFRLDSARLLLDWLSEQERFPLLLKPVEGRLGSGIRKIDTPESARRIAEELFADPGAGDRPLMLQRLERFRAEFRVLVVEGEALGVAQKLAAPGELAANAAAGAEWVASSRTDVAEFAARSVHPKGVIGADVGVTEEGELRLIEANRAPLWRAFQAATGLDVARLVLDRQLSGRVQSPISDELELESATF